MLRIIVMTAKKLLFHDHARQRMAIGLDALANAVKVTLGPRGRHVGLERPFGSPTISKDGVTVAKEIELKERAANMGAQMVKEVASSTAAAAGDGTTTATVLAQILYHEGSKLVAAGVDPMELKRGIDAAVAVVVADLERRSVAVRDSLDIARVGALSANGDAEIGRLLADAVDKVGREGVITIEEDESMEMTLELVEGMRFDRGFVSAYFINQTDRMEAVLENAYVLLLDQHVTNLRELLPLLEKIAEAQKPILVIAENVSGSALAGLVVNTLRGSLRACAVKAPGFGGRRRAQLDDIAALTGGRAVTAELGIELEKLTLTDLGRARMVVVDDSTTTLIGGAGTSEAIQARIGQLRFEMEESTSDFDQTQLEQRIAKLAGGVAVIHVGAATETELKERAARVDDALHATQAAVEEGIVPGGGVALLRALPALEELVLAGDQRYGVEIVRRALEEPLRQIANNAGVEGAIVVAKVCAGNGAYGYDAATGEYGNLLDAGVIDPTKVVRVALQNAASVASLMLTTEVGIVEAE